MSFVDVGISYQPPSNIDTREEHQINRKKYILRIGLITALIFLFITLIITLTYVFINQRYTRSLCIVDIHPTTSLPIQTQTSTFDALLTTDITEERIVVLNPCIEQYIEYEKWGMPIQNYSLYSIDASLLILSASVSINITMHPSNIDCAWSLDIFPMDGRPIPFSGRPTNSVFGFYDQNQSPSIEELNVSSLDYWTNGTGKFLVGITGAWYGPGNVGCQGYGKLKLCFSHS